MIRWLLAIAVCLAVMPTARAKPPREPLTAEVLKKAWLGVAGLEADIDQTKTSPHFTRPLKSHVHLVWARPRIVWTVLDPVRAEMVIEDGRIVSGGPAIPASVDNGRTAALGRLLQALFSVDIDALRRDYDVEFGPDRITAKARAPVAASGDGKANAPASAPLVQELGIVFDANLRPAVVTVVTAAETTELKFVSLQMRKDSGGKP